MTTAIVADSRITRGIRLAAEHGSEFEWCAPLRWRVPGSNGATYNVTLEEHRCDCPDFQIRAERDQGTDIQTEPCKHIVAVEIEGAHRRTAARRRKTQRAKVA